MKKIGLKFCNVQEIINDFLIHEKKTKCNGSKILKLFQDLHFRERLYNYTRYIQKISLRHWYV